MVDLRLDDTSGCVDHIELDQMLTGFEERVPVGG